MFAIDLLKGQAVPIKSRPEGIAIVAATIAVPILATMVLIGYSVHNKVIMSIQKQRMLNYQGKTEELSFAMDLQQSAEAQKNAIKSCLDEVASSLGRHTQWSPTLVTLVKNLPGAVVMKELSVKQRPARLKIPQKDNPQKMIDVTAPARTLHIIVSGRAQEGLDEKVKSYRETIRTHPAIERNLKDVRVSQGSDKLDGQEAVSYEIDCIFKPSL